MEFVPLWIFVTTVVTVVIAGLVAVGSLLAYILRAHLGPMRETSRSLKASIDKNASDIKELNTTILREIRTISSDSGKFTLKYTEDMGDLREYIHLNFPGRQELTDKLNSLEKNIKERTDAVHARMRTLEQRFENSKH